MYLSYRYLMRRKGTFMHFKAGPILCTFVKILVPLWRFNIVYGYTKNSTLNRYAHWMCVSDSFIIFKFYSLFLITVHAQSICRSKIKINVAITTKKFAKITMRNKASDSDLSCKPIEKSAKNFSHTFLLCTYHAKVSHKIIP